jgi:hypothetical protein
MHFVVLNTLDLSNLRKATRVNTSARLLGKVNTISLSPLPRKLDCRQSSLQEK